MRQWTESLNSITKYCTDFLLPPICISCHTSTWEHNTLCPKCWLDINFIVSPICDILGIPMPYDIGSPNLSAAALAYPPLYDKARSVAHYEGTIKKLIHKFKYGDHHEGINLFGRWMAAAGQDILENTDLIIPVPLSRMRLWSRRFNQAALLAHAVGKHCKKPVNTLSVIRTKHTRAQVGLTRKQREKNVSAAFTIPKPRQFLFNDKNITLIDDVLTTGATITACTKALKKAKAERVYVLTLARVVDQNPMDI